MVEEVKLEKLTGQVEVKEIVTELKHIQKKFINYQKLIK